MIFFQDWRYRSSKDFDSVEDEYNFYPRIGGKMRAGQRVVLSVNNTLERRKIYNTHGIIRGSLEPGGCAFSLFILLSFAAFEMDIGAWKKKHLRTRK